MNVTVRPTLDKRLTTHVLMAGRRWVGDVHASRRPVDDHPFMVGPGPVRWVAEVSLWGSGSSVSGRRYVADSQAEVLAAAQAGAASFIGGAR